MPLACRSSPVSGMRQAQMVEQLVPPLPSFLLALELPRQAGEVARGV